MDVVILAVGKEIQYVLEFNLRLEFVWCWIKYENYDHVSMNEIPE